MRTEKWQWKIVEKLDAIPVETGAAEEREASGGQLVVERVVGEVQLVSAHTLEQPAATHCGCGCDCRRVAGGSSSSWCRGGVRLEQCGHGVHAERRMGGQREEPEKNVDRRLLH